METINGVTFEEYAAACGNLATGMPEDRVLEILNLEKPIWDETLDKWNDKFGELLADDMSYATKYGELFANPRAGRFSEVEANTDQGDDTLALAPDYETYQKIFWHQSVASNYGIDPVTVLESYGINLGQWGSLNMHYLNYQNELLDHKRPDYAEKFDYFSQLQNKWRGHFENYYINQRPDLSSDIEF